MTTAAETTTPQQDENPRKKLYRALIGSSNEDAKAHFKQFSFDQFNKRLDDEKFVQDLYESIQVNNVVLDPKNRQPEQNYYDFIDAYVKVPTAKPATPVAKPAAAPVAAAPIEQAAPIPSVEPMEEEEIPEVEYEGQMLPEVTAYGNLPKPGTQLYEEIMRTNPPVGSDEYNLKIAVQNQLPPVELGAGGYGGVLQAPFETTAQIEQEAQSPAFRRQKLAEAMMQGEVPVVTQQGVQKAQEGFRKATKEQQQAAIMGSPGYEYEQERKAQERGVGEATGNLFGAFGADADRLTESILSGMVNSMAEQIAAQRTVENPAYLMDPTKWEEGEKKYKGIVKEANKRMFQEAKSSEEEFRNEIAKRNIQTSILDAVNKGKYNRVPEALLYTIGDAAMQMGAALASRGGSMYFQTLPMEYKDEVEAIARETNRTPEQVIAAGDDAPFVAKVSSIGQAVFERIGANQISKGIGNKGGYKAVRDWLIKGTKNKTLARAGGLAFVAGAEAGTEGIQTGISQVATLSTSQKPFMDKVDRYFSPEFKKARLESEIAGAIGGGFLGGAGRAVTKAFEKGPDITQFSPEVQGNEIIQEATRGYQDNIAKAEEQGRKPDAFNKRELNKLATDPEAWVKGEIKYLTQTIQDNKKNNIDSKVEETKLAEHNALLAQIKAEKKGMEQAALAPAQEAAQVAPEAPVAPAETITAPQVTAPVAFPSDEQIADDIQNRRFATFTYSSESEVPEQFRDKISSRGETNGVPFVRVTLPQSVAEYEASRATPEAPVAETAPVTEEALVAEEAIPVAPETEEDYSFLEETELTPEEEAALLAQEEAAPVEPEAAPETQKAEIEKKSKDLEKRYNALQKRHKKELSDLNKKEGKNYEDTFDILNINEYSRDKTPRSKEAIELANRHEKEFQELLQEQRSLQDMAGEISYSSYDFSRKKPILQKLKEAIGAVYRKDKNALDEGFMNSYEALDRANQVGGGNYVAHGMGKASIPQAYNALVELFTKGINPQRGGGRLYVAPLSGGISTGQTASGNAYMDGPFTLVANREHQGDITDINQVGGIIVNDGIATDDVISSLRDLFPNLIIESTSNTDKLVEQLNQKSEQQAAPAEQVAPEAAPAKEVGVGGIIYGHEDIVGNKGLGDVRSQLPEENSGVIIANGKDGNQYAVAFSRKGGDRQNIFEQTPAARPGHIYTSVKIDDPSNSQEVEQAKKQAEAALAEILPTVKGGNIRASAVQQAITDFQTKKTAEPAPAPKAKKAPAPKAETKQETPKTETKKEEAPKTEAKPVSTTPQEGATVEIPAQRAEFGTRNMVFKDGEWKQNVGGDILKVGPAVQQQAQEAFAGKEETKPAETKEGGAKETSFKGITSFETAKGSVYTVLPDGRTQRFKTATKEQNEPQDLTVFVKFKDAAQEQDFLEGVQRSETSGTKVYVIDKQGNKYDTNAQAAGKDVRLALVKDGKVIDTAETSTTPKIGYNAFDQRRFEKNGEKYREAHLGNKVVKINEQTETAPKEEGKKPSAKELASQVEDMRSLPPAKRKAAQQALEERYGKEDVAKMIEITANFTKIIDDLEQRGVVKIDCP